MPPIAYYSAIRRKHRQLRYEVRHNMVMLALKDGIKPTARYFGASRNTVRKWLRRHEQSGAAGLEEQSRAPHHIPHKTDAKTEAAVIKLKERLLRYGCKRLVRDYEPGCSHGAMERICREQGLNSRRKRKRERRNDLRAEKAGYRPGERTCNDTKHLDDIPQYYSQARDLKLPWYQYSHRDVRTGMMFLGFADELSLSHSTAFTEILVAWYKRHEVKLEGGTWSYDGGSEYIGSWNAKEPSSYQRVLAGAKINGLRIPNVTYNAEVETIHNTIEFEFLEVERFCDRDDFFRKANGYQLWYNCDRKNCNRRDQSPREILVEIASEIDTGILMLPVIDLDLVLAAKVEFLTRQSSTGGHDVPWHTLLSLNQCGIGVEREVGDAAFGNNHPAQILVDPPHSHDTVRRLEPDADGIGTGYTAKAAESS